MWKPLNLLLDGKKPRNAPLSCTNERKTSFPPTMAFRAERWKLSSSYAIILFNISHKQVFRHALVVEIYLQQERKNNLLTDSTRTKKKPKTSRAGQDQSSWRKRYCNCTAPDWSKDTTCVVWAVLCTRIPANRTGPIMFVMYLMLHRQSSAARDTIGPITFGDVPRAAFWQALDQSELWLVKVVERWR